MKNLVLGMMITLLAGSVSANTETPVTYTEVQCQFTIQRPDGRVLNMKGYLRLQDHINDETYLTLEPPVVAQIPVTARVLLTRFDTGEYFPMTLHPRGETALYLEHTRLDGSQSQVLQHSQDGFNYTLECHKI